MPRLLTGLDSRIVVRARRAAAVDDADDGSVCDFGVVARALSSLPLPG